MYIRDGQDFEVKVLGHTTTLDLQKKFKNQKPNFATDMRQIIANRNCSRFPQTLLSRSLYYQVEKRLTMLGVLIDELYLFSSIGTIVDLYRETDAFFYLKSNGSESIVTVDLFFLEENLLPNLIDFWVESHPGLLYTQENLQSDLFRFKRITSEVMAGLFEKFRHNGEFSGSFFHSQFFRDLWSSEYVPQARILERDPERGAFRPENHLVITPYQIVNHRQRKILSALIVDLLRRQFPKEALVKAS